MKNPHISDHAPSGYRPDIDGLRAIAVLSVVLFHAFPTLLPGGFIGVDVFFVISGYLISGILFKEFSEKRFSYLDFYSRRARRILPSLILMFWFALIAGWFLLLSGEYSTLGKQIFSSAFFFQNFALFKESGYFDISSNLKPLLHLWSLAIEEQFYLIWPPLIALFCRKKNGLIAAILSISVFSFVLNVLRVTDFPTHTFFVPQTRFWELLTGALLAWISLNRKSRTALFQSKFFSIAGLALFFFGFFFINESKSFPGWWATLPVLGSTLIIGSSPQSTGNRILSNRFLIQIGLISYPLYLWHWVLLAFLRILSPDAFLDLNSSIPARLLCIAVSFVMALLCYRWIETPIRRKPTRKWAIALVVALFTTGLMGRIIQEKNGFSKRTAGTRQSAETKHLVQAPGIPECDPSLRLPTVEWCMTNIQAPSVDVMAIGDSHASMYAAELAEYYKKQNRTFRLYANGDSLGLYDAGTLMGGGASVNGIRSPNAAFDQAVSNGTKTVILASRGPIFLGSSPTKKIRIKDIHDPAASSPVAVYESTLEKTFSLLKKAGIETVFIYDDPDVLFDPNQSCFKRPVNLFDSEMLTTCGIGIEKATSQQKTYRESVTRVLANHPEVKTFDPMNYLCDSNTCFAMKDEILLYRDNNHLSADGATFVGKHFNF